jgi:tripartite-type tricarboxylate transporter receptor subunit TctC
MKLLLWLALAVLPVISFSQEYPSRPIRLLMPNSPGSSIDTVGRIVAAGLGEALGQPLVVDNRAGAAGTIGIEAARVAAPDGYTLLFASASGMSIAPLIRKNIAYDPLNDFGFVSLVVVMPNVLAVNPDLPVHSVAELIAYAKAHPGQVNMASAGNGAASHLGGVLLQVMGGFESLHVPYKGGGASVGSVVSGESHWTIAPAPATMSLVRSGRLRAIAQSGTRRSALFGELPAVAETLPGYDYSGWAGLLGPRGLPAPQVERLRAALGKALEIPKISEALAAQGAEPHTDTPEEFRAFLGRDLESTAHVVKAAGIAPE